MVKTNDVDYDKHVDERIFRARIQSSGKTQTVIAAELGMIHRYHFNQILRSKKAAPWVEEYIQRLPDAPFIMDLISSKCPMYHPIIITKKQENINRPIVQENILGKGYGAEIISHTVRPFERFEVSLKETLWFKRGPYFIAKAVTEWIGLKSVAKGLFKLVKINSYSKKFQKELFAVSGKSSGRAPKMGDRCVLQRLETLTIVEILLKNHVHGRATNCFYLPEGQGKKFDNDNLFDHLPRIVEMVLEA